jgi:AcrR family transcriptional regulator
MTRAERQAQLIGAAAAAFLAGGFDGTSVEAVAERAGVTRLIVYRNFESKHALYRAVLDSIVDALRDEFQPDARRHEYPTSTAAMLVSVARRHPDGFRLLWRHARHEPTFAKQAEEFRQVVATFADEIIRPYIGDVAVRKWAAATVVDYLYGGTCEWLDGGVMGRDDEFAERLQAGARGLVAAWSDEQTARSTIEP